MPTGPITYGVEFFSVLFAKPQKGGEPLLSKPGRTEFYFLSIGRFWSGQWGCGDLNRAALD